MEIRLSRAAAVLAATFLAVSVTVGAARAGVPAPKLLATYEPVTQLDPLESFTPTKVESFVADSALEQLVAGTWSVVNPQPGPGNLPGPGTATWRLNQESCTPSAPVGGLSCYAPAFADGSGGPAVYGRVARQNGRIVLQYWYFYYDDVYSYLYPPSDFIWQAHEGDWEVVNVVLTNRARPVPLTVGYSQHCLGERRAWAGTPRLGGTHAIVHVALGSHANYFTVGTHPINVSCIPPQAVAFLRMAGLPLPVDYAFPGAILGPPRSGGAVLPILQISAVKPNWIRFPGAWGELQYFHGPAPIGTVAIGGSPVGPAYHDVWRDPLGTLATWPAS